MASLSHPVAGIKPAGPASAAPTPAQPDRQAWRHEPTPEREDRWTSRRDCLANRELAALAALLGCVRELAYDHIDNRADRCECGVCLNNGDSVHHNDLATAAGLNAELIGSAIDSGIVHPLEEIAPSDGAVADRLEAIARYIRGLQDGEPEDMTEVDVEADSPIISKPR